MTTNDEVVSINDIINLIRAAHIESNDRHVNDVYIKASQPQQFRPAKAIPLPHLLVHTIVRPPKSQN